MQNLSITNSTVNASGDYTVKSIVGKCEKTKTITIDVLPGPSCSPANNTINFVSTMNFTSNTCGIASSGRYEFNGTGLQGDVRVEFYVNPLTKGNFIYDLSTMDKNSSNAFMQIDIGGVLSNWQATSGKLFVRIINNKMSATFCSATFGNIQGASPRNGSGKLSCP